MNNSHENLVALVGSRICHDLISPIGAISNGVELMSMAGSTGEQELALISESVENANARIRFFRVAFGYASPDQMIGAREVTSILNDMTRGSRVSVNWAPKGDILRAEARLAFLVLLCLETAMPFGGTVAVSKDDNAWTLEGEAGKLRLEDAHWDILIDPTGSHDVTASIVHFALAPEFARTVGRTLNVDLSETRIVVSF